MRVRVMGMIMMHGEVLQIGDDDGDDDDDEGDDERDDEGGAGRGNDGRRNRRQPADCVS